MWDDQKQCVERVKNKHGESQCGKRTDGMLKKTEKDDKSDKSDKGDKLSDFESKSRNKEI